MNRALACAMSVTLLAAPDEVQADPTGISAPAMGLRLTGATPTDRPFAVSLAVSGPETALLAHHDGPEDPGAPKGPAPSPVHVGDRVRVRAPALSKTAVGEVLALDDGVMTVVREDGTRLDLAVDGIAELEVSRGTQRMTKKGALIGALTGAAIAVGWVFAACPDCYEEEGFATAVALFAGLSSLTGAGVGALVGRAVEQDRWEEVDRPRRGLHILPVRQGVMAAVSVEF